MSITLECSELTQYCHGYDDINWAFLLIADIGLEIKEATYKEKDMCCVPKFTQPLVDRSVVAGYSTAISCAVRGFPKVMAS